VGELPPALLGKPLPMTAARPEMLRVHYRDGGSFSVIVAKYLRKIIGPLWKWLSKERKINNHKSNELSSYIPSR
jgi:hypothetical protein